jgi:hypothetical protein
MLRWLWRVTLRAAAAKALIRGRDTVLGTHTPEKVRAERDNRSTGAPPGLLCRRVSRMSSDCLWLGSTTHSTTKIVTGRVQGPRMVDAVASAAASAVIAGTPPAEALVTVDWIVVIVAACAEGSHFSPRRRYGK